VPDVIAPDLRVLLRHQSGTLYGGDRLSFRASGQPLWPALYASGFTDHARAFEELELLKSGYGITNVVARATAAAAELSAAEFVEGGKILERRCGGLSRSFSQS
jgi:TDG/mug DNA glycosylase family protein